MTGRLPHNNGMMGLTNIGNWRLNDDERALPTYLSDAGYHTVRYAQQHVGDDERLGFDSVHNGVEFSEGEWDGFPWWPALTAAETFEDTYESELGDDQPFFAYVGFSEPHQPYRHQWVPDEAYEAQDPEAVTVPDFLPDTEGVREDIAELNACVEGAVDPAFGQIRETLEAHGVLDDTLIMFTADHGIDMPRAKGMCYRAGIEIPLIFRHPALEPAVFDDLVSNVDVLPTLLDLLGVDATHPNPLDGQSAAGLMSDADVAYEPRDRLFAEFSWHTDYNPIRTIRTEAYAYHRTFTNTPLVYMPYHDSRAASELRSEYYTQKRPMEQLYDLREDPLERSNLAPSNTYDDGEGDLENAERPEVLADLREQLHEKLSADGDPILDGPIELPSHSGW